MKQSTKEKHRKRAHQNLHELEGCLIEINGLMQALQQVLPDGAAHTCVANALTDKIARLEQGFYEHWNDLFVKHQNREKS